MALAFHPDPYTLTHHNPDGADHPVGRPTAVLATATAVIPAGTTAAVGHGVPTVDAGRPSAAVYRRRRIAVIVGALVALYMTVLLVSSVAQAAGSWFVTTAGASSVSGDVPVTVVVEPGDTLWSIAASLDTDADIRTVVADLASANGGSQIRPGQVLDLRSALR